MGMRSLVMFAQDTGLKVDSLPQPVPGQDTFSTAFTIVVGVLSAIAVLIIVLAGFKYITSAGDPQGVASARKAIIYAIVGLIVCFSAWSIVTFVIKGV